MDLQAELEEYKAELETMTGRWKATEATIQSLMTLVASNAV